MPFGDNLESILPSYLVSDDKNRLKDALKQFTESQNGKDINYSAFYKNYGHAYFMQSDLIKEIRMSLWNQDSAVFEKVYQDAIVISNTCDISFDNKRNLNPKQCLFAPLIELDEYVNDLSKSGYDKVKLDQHIQTVRAQLITNIFYLPMIPHDTKEYIVALDNIFWFPVEELNSYIDRISENRISSLSHFGYYLFILKLSYHLSRLPEQCDREINPQF